MTKVQAKDLLSYIFCLQSGCQDGQLHPVFSGRLVWLEHEPLQQRRQLPQPLGADPERGRASDARAGGEDGADAARRRPSHRREAS